MTEYRILNVGRRLGNGPITFSLKVGKRETLEQIEVTDRQAFEFAIDILKALKPPETP